jgi:hypothetical protein
VLGIGLGLALLVVGIALVAVLKTRAAFARLAAMVAPMERPTRRAAIFAAIPGLIVAVRVVVAGVSVVPAFIVGSLAFFGILCVTLAFFKLEGVLWETESNLFARTALGQPTEQRLAVRIVTFAVGGASLVGTLLTLRLLA